VARAATAPARPRTAPAPRRAPRTAPPPRRRSGATVPKRAPSRRQAPRIARVLEAPAARLLDTLLTGRAWIALIGVLLAGIVFFNVSLLGLNQGITRDSARAQTLEQRNAQLRLAVADLGSSERIQQLAEKRGMIMPAAGQVSYVRSRKSDARRATQNIQLPATQRPAPTTQTTAPQSAVTPSTVSAPGATTAPTTPAQPTTPTTAAP
jgi:cell division protein FtsL